MKKSLIGALLAMSFAGSANAATISLPNMGFESGLTGWIASGGAALATGPTNVLGTTVSAYTGNNFGVITNTGSFLQAFANITAGDTLTFAYRFLTGEAPGSTTFNDMAFVFGFGNTTIATVATATSNDSGWQIFNWTSPITYNGPVGFGLANVGDNAVSSAVAIDFAPVPVPAAAWLFGSALLGGGVLRRKQKTA